MALSALAHQTSAPALASQAHARDTGFELGWDYAHYGVVPPAAHLHPLSPVRQGWQAGRQAFGQRTLQTNRFVRKWLQLRLGAWLRGRAFEGTQVNPTFLGRIDVAMCPITREPLTHDTGQLSDASVRAFRSDRKGPQVGGRPASTLRTDSAATRLFALNCTSWGSIFGTVR